MSNKDSPTAERRRIAVKYVEPRLRDSCARCRHSTTLDYEPAQLRCTRHVLRVHKLGHCPSFVRWSSSVPSAREATASPQPPGLAAQGA